MVSAWVGDCKPPRHRTRHPGSLSLDHPSMGWQKSIGCGYGNLLRFPAVKEFWKSVKNWQSYRHEFGVLFFWDTVYITKLYWLVTEVLHDNELNLWLLYWVQCPNHYTSMPHNKQIAMALANTSSSAVAKRLRDASCLSVVSFNSTKRRTESFIVSYIRYRFITAI